MTKYTASIIMPLYNAEHYLEVAIQSVIEQTEGNIEIICVDDCSADDTGVILEAFSKKNNFIKMFRNNERKGAAYSRNIGLDAAEGEYVLFFDGDDILDHSLIQKAIAAAKRDSLDVVVFKACAVNEEGEYIYQMHDPFSVHGDDVLRGKQVEPWILATWITAAWNKLYNTSFLKRNHLQFQNLPNSNDVYFSIMSLLLAKRISYLESDEPLVMWRQHSSADRISNHRKTICAYQAVKELIYDAVSKKIGQNAIEGLYLHAYIAFVGQFNDGEGDRSYYGFLAEKGIRDLFKASLRCLSSIDDKYHLLSRFTRERYETGWYIGENRVSVLLRVKDHILWDIWRDKKNVAIWGIGDYGMALIKVAREKGLKIFCLFDNDPKKKGKDIQGIKVLSLEDEYLNNIDMVIIAMKEIRQASQGIEMMEKRNVQTINLVDILYG